MHYFPNSTVRTNSESKKCPSRDEGAAAANLCDSSGTVLAEICELNALHLGSKNSSNRGKNKRTIDFRNYRYYYDQDEDGDT